MFNIKTVREFPMPPEGVLSKGQSLSQIGGIGNSADHLGVEVGFGRDWCKGWRGE
jgi:hypothetical protein